MKLFKVSAQSQTERILREYPWLWATRPMWNMADCSIGVDNITEALLTLRNPGSHHTWWVKADCGSYVRVFPLEVLKEEHIASAVMRVLGPTRESAVPVIGYRAQHLAVLFGKVDNNNPIVADGMMRLFRGPKEYGLHALCKQIEERPKFLFG